MRVAIVYPPDFTRPAMVFGALPLLSACVQRAGYQSSVYDLNAESFSFLTKPDNLKRYIAMFDEMIVELESKSERTEAENQALDSYRRLRVYPRDSLLATEEACDGLRDPEQFYDPDLYRRYDRTVKTTHKFLNALTPRLDPRHETFGDRLYSWLDELVADPYYDFYARDFIPRMHELEPDIIMMSCPFSLQIGPGLFMARMLRREMPSVKFVIGGTGVSDYTDHILLDDRFWDHIDYAITGDGENAVVDVVTAIEGKKSFDEVDALWRRSDDGKILRPTKFKNVNLDESPTPDYRSVDFSHYLLPEKAGIYTTSRGCYYGKCTFCNESFRVGFRRRSPKRVYEDVKNLVEEQGVKHLHFFDPLTPPVTLEHVSKQVAKDGLDLKWYAEVKFEKIYTNRSYVSKLAAGGCAQLQFGFESGVQRVLDSMKKGNDLEKIKIILEHLRDYGITMCGTWFIGFPTEKEEDAKTSWRFWREHAESMHLSLYTGTFALDENIPVYHRPEDFGVRLDTDEFGNAELKQLDGSDWDKEFQHAAYHVRSDLELTICGAGLLYAAYHPERLYKLRGVGQIGPTSMDGPAIADRFARTAPENNVLIFEDTAGKTRRVGFVAASLRDFELDEIDVAILDRIGPDGANLGDIMKLPEAPADIEDRLALFINRGFIESKDEKSENARMRDVELVQN